MSHRSEHQGGGQTQTEEHIHNNGEPARKAIGLLAKDAEGSNFFEIQGISGASGYALLTKQLDPPASSGGVTTVFQGGNWEVRSVLSVASIYGKVSLVDPVDIRSILSTPTLNVVTQGTAGGMTTLFPGPNQIGSVTVSNFTAPNLGNVTLNPSPNLIGIVTVANPGGAGMTTLFPGPNQIGSVTVSNIPAVTQSGNWDIRSVLSLASIYGKVAIDTLPTGTNFIGLMTVTSSNPGSQGMTTLFPGPNYIGLVTNTMANAIPTGTNFIGLMTVTSSNPGSQGMVTLFGGPNQIGSVTVSNFTAPNTGNITLNAGPNFVGLVTSYPARSMTTLFAGYVSASGYSTIFVPPSNQRFFIHNALINSKGVADGFLGSSTNPMVPFTALATYGGFVMPNADPGLSAPATNQSLTIRQYSLVTISYSIPVHFE